MNILLVDDEVAVIQILKKAVCWEELGINEVFTAYNAQEAKRIVTQESIQIIISDIEMPPGERDFVPYMGSGGVSGYREYHTDGLP